jgi:hypothetical protein
MHITPHLEQTFLDAVQRRIETRIVPVMEAIYREPLRDVPGPFTPDAVLPSAIFPDLKPIERVVCYFDYGATGISVVAPLAAAGDERAAALVRTVLANATYYARQIHGKYRWQGESVWETPLRRLLAHLGLAWPSLEAMLPDDELAAVRELITTQVKAAIAHNSHFWPGISDELFLMANNHTAIFAQGIWLCGHALHRPDWVDLIADFAQRYLEAMHPDGYFDENAQPERLGGPSMVYTPLTAGSLYDILDGRHRRQPEFLQAGRFYRRFLTADDRLIPLADERTNHTGPLGVYGLALHALTPEGRGLLLDLLSREEYLAQQNTEGLAVLHHEVDLMTTGPTATPENRQDGAVRITLPLGVLRRDGWTAGLCGVRATNHECYPHSDYALDQQSHVYLAHERLGILLPGTKGKNNPHLSTCRRGDDAYPIATGALRTQPDRLSVTVHYRTFDVRITWEMDGAWARLRFESESPEEIVTTLPLTATAESCLRTEAPYAIEEVPGFSPYTAGNRTAPVRALEFVWRGRLEVGFEG